MNFRDVITIEPGKRSGQPCIRSLRITVGDILGWLAAGDDIEAILEYHPALNEDDIRAALAFAAEKENHTMIV